MLEPHSHSPSDQIWKGQSGASAPDCPLCEHGEVPLFCARNESGMGERQFFRCPDCALVFLSPSQRLSPTQEKSRYDFHRNSSEDKKYVNFLSRLAVPLSLRLKAGASGLDFGCGPGPAMSYWFREKGFKMEDYDPIYFADAGLLERTYDFVTCSETAEHFYHPRREFLLLDRLLKPGALLGVMTCVLEDAAQFETWWYAGDPTHVSFYERRTLEWIAGWRGWTLDFQPSNVAIFQK